MAGSSAGIGPNRGENSEKMTRPGRLGWLSGVCGRIGPDSVWVGCVGSPSYVYSRDSAGKTWNMARAPNRARENGNPFVVTGVVTTGCGAHIGWLVMSCRVGQNDYFSGLPYLLIYLLCVCMVCESVCIKR